MENPGEVLAPIGGTVDDHHRDVFGPRMMANHMEVVEGHGRSS